MAFLSLFQLFLFDISTNPTAIANLLSQIPAEQMKLLLNLALEKRSTSLTSVGLTQSALETRLGYGHETFAAIFAACSIITISIALLGLVVNMCELVWKIVTSLLVIGLAVGGFLMGAAPRLLEKMLKS
ncbi:uncharacterized protein KY384_003435 [Bacidia gigantensis]|uniref:uncharacterized protein n=1 Tax=Bacidia gigantensis TaxID=2732470 RepID=UPI001D03D285|nr:uncharacterized protein KY384_003435 [Bacidia gigantensis]KAG8531799.1 hypothetical protein KY384_003435 [Bacidia gigantensis]